MLVDEKCERGVTMTGSVELSVSSFHIFKHYVSKVSVNLHFFCGILYKNQKNLQRRCPS